MLADLRGVCVVYLEINISDLVEKLKKACNIVLVISVSDFFHIFLLASG